MTYSGSLARRALLCAATSLIALSAGSALAQSSSTASTQDKAEGTTLQDIVVTGARRAQTVLEQERAAVGVVDSVAVGDISLNPQTNIADLAKRLPGVSVSQDQGRNQSPTGEAAYVADAIAGIVNLVTPSAFDFGDQMLRLRAVGQMAELAEDRGQDGLGGAIGLDMSRRFA